MVSEQYKGKDALINPNVHALEIGRNYALDYLDNPLPIQLRRSNAVGERIIIEGNTASAYRRATAAPPCARWYPIHAVDVGRRVVRALRGTVLHAKRNGQEKFAIMQAEDDLAAIGMVIGAAWNGARAFHRNERPWPFADGRVPRSRVLRRDSGAC